MDRRKIERDIDRLGRCLDRVETLHAIRSYDFQVQMVRDYLQKTMWKIFGPESKEWESCRSLGVMVGVDMERSPETVFRRRITETVKYLSSLRVSLEDSLADLNDDRSNRMGSLFRHLNLNQRITEAAATLFTQGHRRQAVFDAYLALQEFVQTKAGRPDLDGPDLMRTHSCPN
jgi:hypothetical protein